jgi:hypothetical protein
MNIEIANLRHRHSLLYLFSLSEEP